MYREKTVVDKTISRNDNKYGIFCDSCGAEITDKLQKIERIFTPKGEVFHFCDKICLNNSIGEFKETTLKKENKEFFVKPSLDKIFKLLSKNKRSIRAIYFLAEYQREIFNEWILNGLFLNFDEEKEVRGIASMLLDYSRSLERLADDLDVDLYDFYDDDDDEEDDNDDVDDVDDDEPNYF